MGEDLRVAIESGPRCFDWTYWSTRGTHPLNAGPQTKAQRKDFLVLQVRCVWLDAPESEYHSGIRLRYEAGSDRQGGDAPDRRTEEVRPSQSRFRRCGGPTQDFREPAC